MWISGSESRRNCGHTRRGHREGTERGTEMQRGAQRWGTKTQREEDRLTKDRGGGEDRDPGEVKTRMELVGEHNVQLGQLRHAVPLANPALPRHAGLTLLILRPAPRKSRSPKASVGLLRGV